ncbi:MAG: zinc-dependent peptidase [Burkholderiaceae bacterium]|nr:zinc-dependent peptidase [Burkholderiaceae bacterium]
MFARLLDSIVSGSVEIPPPLWEQTRAALPFLRRFDTQAGASLRELCARLLATKVMSGAGGLELTAAIQVAIGAQACLPILRLGIDWYRGWSGIIVYPSEYVARRRIQDESGLVHEFEETAAGEAWEGGPVIVSWDPDAHAPENSAFNVVIHEFAHKLDLLDGQADGLPPLDRRLHAGLDPHHWRGVLEDVWQRFAAAVDLVELDLPADIDPESDQADPYYARLPLDPYAAQDEAEFFAVSSETFFVSPQRLLDAFPQWYELLSRFYLQDPLAA